MIEDSRDEKLAKILWDFIEVRRSDNERDAHEGSVFWDHEDAVFKASNFAECVKDAGLQETRVQLGHWLKSQGGRSTDETIYGKRARFVRVSRRSLRSIIDAGLWAGFDGGPTGMAAAYQKAWEMTLKTRQQHLPRYVGAEGWEVVVAHEFARPLDSDLTQAYERDARALFGPKKPRIGDVRGRRRKSGYRG